MRSNFYRKAFFVGAPFGAIFLRRSEFSKVHQEVRYVSLLLRPVHTVRIHSIDISYLELLHHPTGSTRQQCRLFSFILIQKINGDIMKTLHPNYFVCWALLFLPQVARSTEWERPEAALKHHVVCDSIWAGHNHNNTGRVCLQVQKSGNVQDGKTLQIHLSYELVQPWQLQEHFLWMGKDLSELPQLHNGKPDLDGFPVSDKNIEGQTIYNLSVPVTAKDMPETCSNDGARTTLYMALHPVIVPNTLIRKTQRSNEKDSFLRGQSQTSTTEDRDSFGFPWMEFELVLPCQTKGESVVEHQETSAKSSHSGIVPLLDFEVKRHQQKFLQQRQLNEECQALPPEVETSDILTETFLNRFQTCSTLSMHVVFDRKVAKKKAYYREEYDYFDAFDDGINDAAVVAKTNEVCYAVFRGTQELNWFDNVQNIMPGFRKIPGTDCFARRGFYDAYFTNYQEDFEDSVRECVNSCEGGQCELILSGGSQGAGAAVIAGIQLFEEYDPYVFSIGVMRAFLPTSPFNRTEVCTHFNKDRHYHFILTDTELEIYDPVPYMFGFWAKNAGHEILYDGDGNFNYQGVSRNYNTLREPSSMIVHSRWNYITKSENTFENLCLPSPAIGWRDGHWCSEDGNCMTTSYCGDDGICAPRLELAAICRRSAACKSGSCVDGHCCPEKVPLLSVNEKCRRDNECESGRCEGMLGFSTCRADLVESGEKCNEHSDCTSGYCAGLVVNRLCL